jgi:hypothetical protein
MADEAEEQREARRRTRERAAEIPATFVDTYSIDWSADSVRISFAEYLHRTTHYRVAVVLPMEDAQTLGESLVDIAKRARHERGSG